MRLSLFLAAAALIACGDDTTTTRDSATPAVTGDSGGTTSGTDTGPNPNLDQDHDGYKAADDCDDNNAQVHPGADEVCDEADNDCDDLVDEGFDADSDGHTSAELCEAGTDCDDAAATVNPDAEEVPYDGIDQDCSGADLTDVDGDGHDAEAAGGGDCDDDDAAIHPGAEDIPKDGIDQDCTGADSLDGDGDGYDDREEGGDDCDDEDPTVNPGAIDWADDAINSDCSASTAGRHGLDSWGTTVVGVPGGQSLLGFDSELCDLDEDGLADVIIADPFGGSGYEGEVGIFYGATWSTWTKGMALSAADTYLTGGGTYAFFAAGVVCADVDGDSHLDLVVANSEADISGAVDEDYGLYIFYGDGNPLDAVLSRDDADAIFTVDLAPVDNSQSTVYLNYVRASDLDGNGAADLVVYAGSEDLGIWDGEPRLVLIEGNRYSGYADLEDQAMALLSMQEIGYIDSLTALPDLDGDGTESFMLSQASYSPESEDTGGDTGDTGDTGETDPIDEWLPYEGRIQLIASLPTGEGDFADHLSLTGHGAPARLFGLEAAAGDFDADGAQDLVVSALGDPDWALELPGALSFFSDIATTSAGGEFHLEADADGLVLGDEDEGYLGWDLVTAGDADGDSTDDLWVVEILGGTSDEGWLFLVGGEHLSGDLSIDDAAMLSFYGGNPDDALGYGLSGGGDIDGDGVPDAIIGAPTYTTTTDTTEGRAFILLSSDW